MAHSSDGKSVEGIVENLFSTDPNQVALTRTSAKVGSGPWADNGREHIPDPHRKWDLESQRHVGLCTNLNSNCPSLRCLN